jgi:3-isopropylmalate/(R)-2-methylmalate dehydratase small subunit
VSAITRIEGTALPLPGDDIDTDRIIPARFLVSVTFEGLERHVFADDRAARAGSPSPHPFDDRAFVGASILVVNRNFGCGSSREHAPQALQRWGIRAVVGESFSEIFFGNSLALGLPCVTAPPGAVRDLQEEATRHPRQRLVLDLSERTIRAADRSFAAALPDTARDAFLSGHWDAIGLLLHRFEEVETVAAKLPYATGFATGTTLKA